jgi:hypothetical protein
LPGLRAAAPQWATVTPFCIPGDSAFRPPPQPDLDSAEYTTAFNEVRRLGGNGTTTATERDKKQTEIAQFWAGGAGTFTSGGYWNLIAQEVAVARGNTLVENARLFALLNVAQADAYFAVWDAKYAYNFWRPVTAIRAADTDSNPATSPVPDWTPLLVTPNFPSYVSGHSGHSAAAAAVLADFFGTDDISFSLTTDSLPGGVTHSFDSFSEAVREVSDARVFAGIHWRFDVTAGEALGSEVGNYVVSHCLQPRDVDDEDDQLRAAAAAPAPVNGPLRADQMQPVLAEALAHRHAAGTGTSAPHGVDVRKTDPGGTALGLASANSIWLDANAAGWGWFVDQTPRSNREFTTSGNPGEQHRMDLLMVLTHEVGHLLGDEHEPGGVMQETLEAGTRQTTGPTTATDGLGAVPTSVVWTADTPWIDGFVRGTGLRR